MAQERNQRSAYKLDNTLASQVIEGLKKHWSPEQISGVLEGEAGKRIISHKAIYQFIYRQSPDSESLMKYPRIRHKKRYKVLWTDNLSNNSRDTNTTSFYKKALCG